MKTLNYFLLANNLAPDWIVVSFPIIRIVLVAVTALCAITLIITTLMQSNVNDQGSTALTGGSQESYYSQNKGETRDVKLTRATVILASVMALCMVLYFVTLLIHNPS